MNAWNLLPSILLISLLLSSGCVQTPDQNNVNNDQPGKGPKDAYMNYKAEFDRCGEYECYENLVMKYGSSDRISEIQERGDEIDSLPPDFKESIFNMMKSASPTSADLGNEQCEEKIEGNKATLIFNLKDGSLKGTIELVREDNEWKIEKESWKE